MSNKLFEFFHLLDSVSVRVLYNQCVQTTERKLRSSQVVSKAITCLKVSTEVPLPTPFPASNSALQLSFFTILVKKFALKPITVVILPKRF